MNAHAHTHAHAHVVAMAVARWVSWVDPWYPCSVDLEAMVDRLLDSDSDDEYSDYVALCRLCNVPATL